MKQGKRPTKKQKNDIKSVGLNPENWLVTKNLHHELHIVHRFTNTQKIIPVA
jgi:hypothetical protein